VVEEIVVLGSQFHEALVAVVRANRRLLPFVADKLAIDCSYYRDEEEEYIELCRHAKIIKKFRDEFDAIHKRNELRDCEALRAVVLETTPFSELGWLDSNGHFLRLKTQEILVHYDRKGRL
jgi:DNA-binding GntR family transcriptional regulator